MSKAPRPARRSPLRRATLACTILATAAGLRARRARPAALQVAHRHGQSFVTWQELGAAQGESYRIYRSGSPMKSANDLASAQLLAERPRGSGQHPDLGQGYVLAANAAPLPPNTGFLVRDRAAAPAVLLRRHDRRRRERRISASALATAAAPSSSRPRRRCRSCSSARTRAVTSIGSTSRRR